MATTDLTNYDDDSSPTWLYLNAMYHMGCGSNGCGKKCPYTKDNDPRVFVSTHSNEINKTASLMRDTLSSQTESIAADIRTYPILGDTLPMILSNENASLDRMFAISNGARAVDMSIATSSSITSASYNAQDHLLALYNGAIVEKNVMVINALVAEGTTTNKIASDAQLDKMSTIDQIDVIASNASVALKTMNASLSQATSNVAPGSPYMNAINAITASISHGITMSRADIVSKMIILANVSSDMETLANGVNTQANVLRGIRNKITSSKESFNNDLPGHMSNDRLNALIRGGDYDTAIIATALEPDIVSNHHKFAKERSTFDNSVSTMSVRDDANDVIPWIAYSRPTYQKTNGQSIEANSMPLSSIPSDNVGNQQHSARRVSIGH